MKKENVKKFIKADEQDDSEISHNRISDMKAFFSLWKFAKGEKSKIVFAIFLQLLVALMVISVSRLFGILIEDGFLSKNYSLAWQIGILIVVFSGLEMLVGWYARVILSKSSTTTILNVRKVLFNQIQLLPMKFYDHQPQGRVVTRLTHDVEGIEDFFSGSLGRFIMSLLMIGSALVAMLLTDFKIGFFLVISIIPALLLIFLLREKIRFTMRKMSKNSSAINAKLSEYLNGIEVIRSHGLENWSKKQYDESVKAFLDSALEANRLYAWSRPLGVFLCTIPIVSLVYFGGKDVLQGILSVGLFVTFIKYCENFIHPVMNIAREIQVVQQAFTSAERLISFLNHDLEDNVLGKNGNIKNVDLEGKLEFKNVSMFYDMNEWILKDINFQIDAGDRIGLVGTTGCGKTSTISLICRLYDFQKGEIYLDDKNIRDYERNFLRSNIGFVSQDVVVFRGSLRNNLTSDNSVIDDDILRASKETGLYDVMQRNRLSLNSLILEDGANLSTGEKQLVALTRVFINNPKILILDEATANIDPGYEKIIHEAVDRLMYGRTCIIIAHRLETLKSCNKIFIFKKGTISEVLSELPEHFETSSFFA